MMKRKDVPGVAKKGLTGFQAARRGCHEAVEAELNRKRALRPLCPAGIRFIKTVKIEVLDRAANFVKEEAAVKAIWEPRAPKRRRTNR